MSDEMYREVILDYYQNPRNKGTIGNPEISAMDYNPLCGDKITFQINLEADGKVAEAKFDGEGCAISQASASMLTEMVIGKDINDLRKISRTEILESLGNPELGPVRIKCALLSLKVMKVGVYSHLGEKIDGSEE